MLYLSWYYFFLVGHLFHILCEVCIDFTSIVQCEVKILYYFEKILKLAWIWETYSNSIKNQDFFLKKNDTKIVPSYPNSMKNSIGENIFFMNQLIHLIFRFCQEWRMHLLMVFIPRSFKLNIFFF